jgi:hypothetical protein
VYHFHDSAPPNSQWCLPHVTVSSSTMTITCVHRPSSGSQTGIGGLPDIVIMLTAEFRPLATPVGRGALHFPRGPQCGSIYRSPATTTTVGAPQAYLWSIGPAQ